MAELKPCPFCGGEDTGILTTSYDGYWYAVFCENCMIQTRKCRQEKDAIEAWNTRVPQTEVKQYGENCTNITNSGTLNLTL